MKKILISLFFLINITTATLTTFHYTYAAEGGEDCGNRTLLGVLPAWDKYLDHEEVEGRCNPVLNGAESALPIGIALLEVLIRLAGFIAVIMIIIGSFKFITSQGSSDAATAARKTIINSLIGLVIVIISTTVVTLIGRSLVS